MNPLPCRPKGKDTEEEKPDLSRGSAFGKDRQWHPGEADEEEGVDPIDAPRPAVERGKVFEKGGRELEKDGGEANDATDDVELEDEKVPDFGAERSFLEEEWLPFPDLAEVGEAIGSNEVGAPRVSEPKGEGDGFAENGHI